MGTGGSPKLSPPEMFMLPGFPRFTCRVIQLFLPGRFWNPTSLWAPLSLTHAQSASPHTPGHLLLPLWGNSPCTQWILRLLHPAQRARAPYPPMLSPPEIFMSASKPAYMSRYSLSLYLIGPSPLPHVAPQVGFEPTTLRLTAGCSTAELLRIIGTFKTA